MKATALDHLYNDIDSLITRAGNATRATELCQIHLEHLGFQSSSLIDVNRWALRDHILTLTQENGNEKRQTAKVRFALGKAIQAVRNSK